MANIRLPGAVPVYAVVPVIPPDGFTVTEVIGARSPGWYEMECDLCGQTTTGSEPVVDDWAWEHEKEHEADLARDVGFAG